jgi:hypothetical protein
VAVLFDGALAWGSARGVPLRADRVVVRPASPKSPFPWKKGRRPGVLQDLPQQPASIVAGSLALIIATALLAVIGSSIPI